MGFDGDYRRSDAVGCGVEGPIGMQRVREKAAEEDWAVGGEVEGGTKKVNLAKVCHKCRRNAGHCC